MHLDRISFMFNGVLPPHVDWLQAPPKNTCRPERRPVRHKRPTQEVNINDDVVEVQKTDRPNEADTSPAQKPVPKGSQRPKPRSAEKSQSSQLGTVQSQPKKKQKTAGLPNQSQPTETAARINADDPDAQLPNF